MHAAGEPGAAADRTPVLFVDRCLGSVMVPKRLRELGVRTEVHDDHFASTEEDAAWLEEVGKRGWSVLTEDRHIRTRLPELISLLKANTHVFVLRVKGLTGEQKAEAFAKAADEMLSLIRHRPAPLLVTITPSGAIATLDGFKELWDRYHQLAR